MSIDHSTSKDVMIYTDMSETPKQWANSWFGSVGLSICPSDRLFLHKLVYSEIFQLNFVHSCSHLFVHIWNFGSWNSSNSVDILHPLPFPKSRFVQIWKLKFITKIKYHKFGMIMKGIMISAWSKTSVFFFFIRDNDLFCLLLKFCLL